MAAFCPNHIVEKQETMLKPPPLNHITSSVLTFSMLAISRDFNFCNYKNIRVVPHFIIFEWLLDSICFYSRFFFKLMSMLKTRALSQNPIFGFTMW